MAIELVTGRAGRAHVDSSDVRAFNAYATASGRYVLHGGGAEIESANDLRVLPAEILMDGAHVRITGTGEELTLENGASSYDRIDIVALHYVSVGGEDSRVESVTLEVIKGTPVDTGGGAQDPAMPVPGTSILDGSSEVYVPYVRVKITGLVPGDPEVLLAGRVQMVKDMIAGISPEDLGIKKWLLDNVFKVGYVWMSYTDTSPSGIIGGTWTPITGRFPYFNAGTGTGGSNTHTHETSRLRALIGAINSNAGNIAYKAEDPVSGQSYTMAVWDAGVGQAGNYTGVNHSTKVTGTTDSASNMPPYQSFYAWRRTA